MDDRQELWLEDGLRGKHRTRIREQHMARLLSLLKARKLGVVKLDLVLRAAALLPDHLGSRTADTPEVVAFLAAMVAERYERGGTEDLGAASWARSWEWFGDVSRPPAHHRVAFPVGRTSFYDGMDRLEAQGLITRERRRLHPVTGKRFAGGPKHAYRNRFVGA